MTSRRRESETTRWAAAVEAVTIEVASLAENDDVVLIAFDSGASVPFLGKAGERERFADALRAIKVGDGTDIAAALTEAVEHARAAGSSVVTVELISDGESDEEPAREAAARLAFVAMTSLSSIHPDDGRGRRYWASRACRIRHVRDPEGVGIRHQREQKRGGCNARLAEQHAAIAANSINERSPSAGYPGRSGWAAPAVFHRPTRGTKSVRDSERSCGSIGWRRLRVECG